MKWAKLQQYIYLFFLFYGADYSLLIYFQFMDLADKQNLPIDDFFEESVFANRLFQNNREFSDHLSEKQAFEFNIEDSVDHFIKKEQMPLPLPLHYDECQSIRNDLEADDTNQFEDDSKMKPQIDQFPELDIACKPKQEDAEEELHHSDAAMKEEAPSIQKLQQTDLQLRRVISFLVQHSNQSVEEVRSLLTNEFKEVVQSGVVLELIEKFSRLKKTKEQLVKYCMRKAFKFILQLPKNKHLLQVKTEEKFSFSKCKNRFLKNISEQKSMNNKFLQQIFHQKDFSDDYSLFLAHFDTIMEEDNQKKIKYLAQLLTTEKQGKSRTVEMVKRLPWTNPILDRVKKISRQLLKYADQK